MHKAVKENDFAELTRLLSTGIDVNERDSLNRTALHLAAWRGDAAMIDTLLCAKADVMALAQDGYSALHFAVNAGSIAAVQTLLRKNMNAQLRLKLNKNKRTPLHLAAAKNNLAVVECLLDRGADPLAKTKSGQSAADLAVDNAVIDAIVSKCQQIVEKQKQDLLALDKRPVALSENVCRVPPAAPSVSATSGVSEPPGDQTSGSTGPGDGSNDSDDVAIKINPLKRKMKPLHAPPKIKLGHLDADEEEEY